MHPLLTGHTSRALFVEIMYTGLPVGKASMETTVLQRLYGNEILSADEKYVT
jgi:hypothetical protein